MTRNDKSTVLVRLVTNGPNSVTHGIRMSVDKIANVGFVQHDGKFFMYRYMRGGDPIFHETEMLDLNESAQEDVPTPKRFWDRLFG